MDGRVSWTRRARSYCTDVESLGRARPADPGRRGAAARPDRQPVLPARGRRAADPPLRARAASGRARPPGPRPGTLAELPDRGRPGPLPRPAGGRRAHGRRRGRAHGRLRDAEPRLRQAHPRPPLVHGRRDPGLAADRPRRRDRRRVAADLPRPGRDRDRLAEGRAVRLQRRRPLARVGSRDGRRPQPAARLADRAVPALGLPPGGAGHDRHARHRRDPARAARARQGPADDQRGRRLLLPAGRRRRVGAAGGRRRGRLRGPLRRHARADAGRR
jgi:23S rRNA pseudouridine2605 synthase